MGKYRYLFVFSLPLLTVISFYQHGALAYLPVIEAFVLIPLMELAFRPNPSNMDERRKAEIRQDGFYLFALRATVPVQWGCGFLLLVQTQGELDAVTLVGRILSYGMMCGVIGINVAHELGHKQNPWDQFLAKVLLTSTLYTHFFLEHNFGHHKNVGTPEDPSSARRGEWVYTFWIRSIVFSYVSAWNIGRKRSKGNPIRNEMVHYSVVQLVLLACVFAYFGLPGLLSFLAASIVGWVLLETVQYIEHYGLARAKVSAHRYESVNPTHSWNSDHPWGRAILFELSRHSDHHYLPHKEYALLDHHDHSPQLPTGYPGMMLLSLLPPVYFKVVEAELERFGN